MNLYIYMDDVSRRISKRTAWGGPSERFFLPLLIPHLLITASPQDHSSKTAFLSIPPERAGTELTLSIRPVSLYAMSSSASLDPSTWACEETARDPLICPPPIVSK